MICWKASAAYRGRWSAVGLVHRLAENRAIAEDAALWAVETWALALGVRSEAQTLPRRPPPPRPSNPPPSTVVSLPPANSPPSASVPPQTNAPDVIMTTRGQISAQAHPGRGVPDGLTRMMTRTRAMIEKPQHEVRISQAFYLGVTPVTQAQYEAVMGKNPSHFGGRRDHPGRRRHLVQCREVLQRPPARSEACPFTVDLMV